ncbi:MAG: hypothetical protein ABIF08_00900 [Nanoarchaeota archaeon]
MKSLQKLFLLSCLVFLISISGCIKLELNQKVYSNGMSDIRTTIDMSALYTGLGAAAQNLSSQAVGEALSEQCDNFLANTTLLNPSCTPIPSEYKIIQSGKISLVNNPSFIVTKGFMSTVYRYDVKGTQNILLESSQAQGQEITPEQITQAKAMYGLMGLVLKYKLEMPGTITKTDLGEIVDNAVEFDILDMYDMDHIYVESEETTFSVMTLILLVGIVIIVVLILALIFVRKGNRPRERW